LADIKVAGALLGLQTGREVTVEIVFELAFTENGILDEPFLTTRLDQCFSLLTPPPRTILTS